MIGFLQGLKIHGNLTSDEGELISDESPQCLDKITSVLMSTASAPSFCQHLKVETHHHHIGAFLELSLLPNL